jgi:hypothetical protein
MAIQPTSPPPAAKPRSPVLAVMLSGIFPGLGQLYNRERRKGLLFLIAGAVTAFGPWGALDVDIDPEDIAAGLRTLLLTSLPFLVLALWSVVDAYRVAHRTKAA